jgi:glycerol kinase
MPNHILTLDQGTTISGALVQDHDGKVIAVAQKEFTQVFPQSQIGVAAEAISAAGIEANEITAIGITSQRETASVWDRKTDEPYS